MRRVLLGIAIAASCTAVQADQFKTAPVLMEDGSVKQMIVAKKQPFAVRHPKVHSGFRKVRRTCQVLLPVLQAAGAAAQVVSALR